MQEIADAAGVSRTTVSHTLSGNRPVNPKTAAKIQAIVARERYTPDARAQRLSGSSRVIGLVVPDISAPYFGHVASGVEAVAHERGYVLVVGTAGYDPARETKYFELLRGRLLDGLVYSGARRSVPPIELVRTAEDGPIVLADEPFADLPDVPTVTSANHEAGVLTGRHLWELGHRDIVFMAGAGELRSQADREEGLRTFYPHVLTLTADFHPEDGYRCADSLLRNGTRATAIVCGNDGMAAGVIERLQAEGMHVPRDMSVTGFDDLPADLQRPRLTTIRTDVVGIGRESARLLIDLIEDVGGAETSVVTPVELIVRDSTSSPAGR